jgi:hypothetical protein
MGKCDRARFSGEPMDGATAFECFEVVYRRSLACESKMILDLAGRRHEPVGLEAILQELQHLLLSSSERRHARKTLAPRKIV